MSENMEDVPLELSHELCKLPDVDPSYMSDHRMRVAEFSQKYTKFTDDAAAQRQLKSLAIENRKKRAGQVTLVHNMIIDAVATHLEVAPNVVLEGLLDSAEQLELFFSLLLPNGRSAVIFSYQLLPPPPIESGRDIRDTSPFHRVSVHADSNIQLSVLNVVVLRVKNNIDITQKNVYEELCFNKLMMPEPGNALEGFQEWLQLVGFDPVLSSSNWGELSKSQSGLRTRNIFRGQTSSFNDFVSNTKDNFKTSQITNLTVDDAIMLRIHKHQDKCLILKYDPELATEVDQMVKIWYTTIAMALDSIHSIREESNELGPLAELEYWRATLTKLTSLADFMHSKDVRLAVSILWGEPPYGQPTHIRKFKSHVQNWSELRQRLEAALLEAEDSVKYLVDLSHRFQVFCTSAPPELPDQIRSILYSIRMMYNASRYFNDTVRANVLPVKISNQVVHSFCNYLTDNERRSLWAFPKHEAIARINVCLEVYDQYQKSFAEAKNAMLSDPKEKPWECTEAMVFARLSVFCSDLLKISLALSKYIEMSILHTCRLEGADEIAKRLDNALRTLVTQLADPLLERNPSLPTCLQQYDKEIASMEEELAELMVQMLDKSRWVWTSLKILNRFRDLNISSLCVNEQYFLLLLKFQEEIKVLSKKFNLQRHNPPSPMTLPPISGRIFWIRQFLKKCERPMMEFNKNHLVITDSRAQQVIREYKSLCWVLLHYEKELFSAWNRQLNTVNILLAAPILRRDNLQLAVNWSVYLTESILEAETMWKLGFELPNTIVMLHVGFYELLRNCYKLNQIAIKYNAFRKSISKLHLPLMRSLLYRLDNLIYAGETELTWKSGELPEFCKKVAQRLSDLHDFMETTSTYRIDEPMKRVSRQTFMLLPKTEPLSMPQLIETNKLYQADLARKLNSVIAVCERTAIEIVNKFVDEFDVPSASASKYRWLDASALNVPFDYVPAAVPIQLAFTIWDAPTAANVPRLHRDCMRLYCVQNQKVNNGILAGVKNTFQKLYSRIINEQKLPPMLLTALDLVGGELVLNPTLDYFDMGIRTLTQQIQDFLGMLVLWGTKQYPESVPPTPDDPKPISYNTIMNNNKDVMRSMQSLYGTVSFLKADVDQFIPKYSDWNFLWTTDVIKEVDEFLASNPALSLLEIKFKTYINYPRAVTLLPDSCDIACLRINAGT